MSRYADYAVASDEYDTTRVPVGVDTILTSLTRTNKPLGEQTVLEAGCGTGNYLHALEPHLGRLAGVDFSASMLAQARTKLGEDVELTCGSILDLSFDDQYFDGIVCNQVIHHLDEGPGKADDPAQWPPIEFPNVTRFIEEAYRVLRPGAALVINVSTHDQVVNGFWWAELIPVAVARLQCRLPDLAVLNPLLAAAGFSLESVVADTEGVLQGSSYLDPQGPLKESWRAGDSTWSLATDEEIDSARRQVETMNTDGSIEAYLAARENMRREVGQSTFICARK